LEDDDLLLDDDFFYEIHSSPTMLHHDVVHKLIKPRPGEALPQPWLHASVMPLQPAAGDLHLGGSSGFVSFKDFNVIGSFVKGLLVRMLL
jgi:hypothetical protein